MAATSKKNLVNDALAKIAGSVREGSGQPGRLEKLRYHPFPARMPIWLAQDIIESLSEPGETVLDPMVGSGTTATAALRAGRNAVGADLDPMALLLSRVGTTAFNPDWAKDAVAGVGARAQRRIDGGLKVATARGSFEEDEQEFLKYWFPPRSQKDLFALAEEVVAMPKGKYRDLARVALSSLVIAKSAAVPPAHDTVTSVPSDNRGAYRSTRAFPAVSAESPPWRSRHVASQRSRRARVLSAIVLLHDG